LLPNYEFSRVITAEVLEHKDDYLRHVTEVYESDLDADDWLTSMAESIDIHMPTFAKAMVSIMEHPNQLVCRNDYRGSSLSGVKFRDDNGNRVTDPVVAGDAAVNHYPTIMRMNRTVYGDDGMEIKNTINHYARPAQRDTLAKIQLPELVEWYLHKHPLKFSIMNFSAMLLMGRLDCVEGVEYVVGSIQEALNVQKHTRRVVRCIDDSADNYFRDKYPEDYAWYVRAAAAQYGHHVFDLNHVEYGKKVHFITGYVDLYLEMIRSPWGDEARFTALGVDVLQYLTDTEAMSYCPPTTDGTVVSLTTVDFRHCIARYRVLGLPLYNILDKQVQTCEWAPWYKLHPNFKMEIHKANLPMELAMLKCVRVIQTESPWESTFIASQGHVPIDWAPIPDDRKLPGFLPINPRMRYYEVEGDPVLFYWKHGQMELVNMVTRRRCVQSYSGFSPISFVGLGFLKKSAVSVAKILWRSDKWVGRSAPDGVIGAILSVAGFFTLLFPGRIVHGKGYQAGKYYIEDWDDVQFYKVARHRHKYFTNVNGNFCLPVACVAPTGEVVQNIKVSEESYFFDMLYGSPYDSAETSAEVIVH